MPDMPMPDVHEPVTTRNWPLAGKSPFFAAAALMPRQPEGTSTMHTISPRTIRALALAVILSIPASAAFADSGDGPQFDVRQPVPATGPATTTVTAATLNRNVDNAAQPRFTGQTAAIDENGGGGLLPFDGNAAPEQTADSLPPGFSGNTVAPAHATTSYALR
jgi:hypothetical protein